MLWFANIFLGALVAVDGSRSLPAAQSEKVFDVDVDADGGFLLEQAGPSPAPRDLTRQDRFDIVYMQFRRKYPEYGRRPRNPSQRAISLDFDVETLGQPPMTPNLLLLRSGIDVRPNNGARSSTCADNPFEFPKPSPLFSVDIDGAETKGRQQLQANLEVTTVPMEPQEILSSGMLEDVQSFFNQSVYGARIRNDSKKKNRGIRPKVKSCKTCKVHYTVGLSLANVPLLFAFSRNDKLKQLISRLDGLCSHRVGGCHPDYKGLVALASWVTKNAHSGCPACWTPKQCMFPWLVRTHFGDVARYVAETTGEATLASLTKDVVYVAQVQPNSAAFGGVPYLEYLLFPEYAEIAGLVAPRNSPVTGTPSLPELPTAPEGLCALADKMLENISKIDKILRNRTCAFHGLDRKSTLKLQKGLTTRLWLEEMKQGKDLLSDYDSPLSSTSWTRTVWKSMGSWRMSNKTRGIVYLECRSPEWCVTDIEEADSPVETMRRVTEFFNDHFDKSLGSFKSSPKILVDKGVPKKNSNSRGVNIHVNTSASKEHEIPELLEPPDKQDNSSVSSPSPVLDNATLFGKLPTGTTTDSSPAGTDEDSSKASIGMVFPESVDGGVLPIDIPMRAEQQGEYLDSKQKLESQTADVRLLCFIAAAGCILVAVLLFVHASTTPYGVCDDEV